MGDPFQFIKRNCLILVYSAIICFVLWGMTFAVIPPKVAKARQGPATTDLQALAMLDLNAPGMEQVKAAAQANDLAAVKRSYLEYRRLVSTAKWLVMPDSRPARAAAAGDPASDPAGDRICAHLIQNSVYHSAPKFVPMGQEFNWTFNPASRTDPAYTNEWTYCTIGRTPFWKTLADAYWKTGNEKYAGEWVAQLEDFAAKNPVNARLAPGEPSLWRSLDASERMKDSWPYAYYHFLNSPAFTPEDQWIFLRLLNDHAQLLRRALEKPDRTGNWVTSECFGLYTIGVLFPELKEAPLWRALAMSRLTQELDRTVPPDGFEAELTPSYQYDSLNSYTGPLRLAKLNHLAVPKEFYAKLLAMYQAPVLMMDQSGRDVPTNDSAYMDVTGKAREGMELLGNDPLLEWAVSGGKAGRQPPDSTMLPYAGFYAMRGGWKKDDVFLFFRGGPPGIGHQHEDMLEVVLRAWNKTLLLDPGTYSYDHSDWRRFTTGTASHNTIIVDGKWQHRGPGKGPVSEPVHNQWVTSPFFDYVAATYDGGYQQNVYDPTREFAPEKWVGDLDRSISHTRRVLFLKPYYVLVLDTLDGTGSHTFDAHFHLDAPAAYLDTETQAAFSRNTGDVQLALYPLARDHLTAEIIQGQKEPLLGWFPDQHRTIPTVRYRKQQEAPAVFATFLYPYRGREPEFAAQPAAVESTGLWAQQIRTSLEQAEVVIATDNTAKDFSLNSQQLGLLQARAAGMVIRTPEARKDAGPMLGGWLLSAYQDRQWNFTLDLPAAIMWSEQPGELFIYNAGSQSCRLKITAPFFREVTLAPQTWTHVTGKAAEPVSQPPQWFTPLDSAPAAPNLAK
ncbi:chondroitin ac/alginate lyase [Lucifera butyrica]|uniref:Chondroitin ac/alginate lyase n=2 Tax=Lucifera butyrica TaxID=1351585 RepID=A0A498R241_9FIRM|nr:chondroitin ac/alginate lyase [Lucifera butyrica]